MDVPDELDPILPAADMSMMTTTGSRGPVASWNTGVGSATDADDDRTWDSGLMITGVVVSRNNASAVTFATGKAHAAAATEFSSLGKP